jgi:hypothetical protein
MIIGLTGYARSGKDEVAKILVENYGYKRVAFADKIREFLYETNPQVGGNRLQHLVSTYGWDVAKSQPEVRHLLQSIGVGARKIFGEDFWVDQAIVPMLEQEKVVVTDVRFTNEANIIKKFKGQIWRINRPGVEAVNAHISETQLDEYEPDITLRNEGTLEELRWLVQTRMGSLTHGK